MQVFERGPSDATARLLFIHGWQADHRVWDGVIAELSPKYRCVAVDLPGSGASRDAGGPYTVERFAAGVLEVIEEHGLAPVVVVGHSMGAKIALQLAVDAPDAVKSLVLIAPVPTGPAGFSEKGIAGLRATCGDAGTTRRWLSRLFAGEPDPAALQVVCEAAAETPPDAGLEALESWSTTDLTDASSSLAVPAIVIAPEGDNVEMQKSKVAALLPNCRLVTVAGAGHYAMFEKPREIAAIVATA
jgi:pimeloyl-ACP methyl ester carboxylesterase